MSSSERFRQLTVGELDADQRRAIEPVLSYAGGIRGPFNATLRSAELTARSFALGQHLLFETTLPRRLVEMTVLIAARMASSQVEWSSHRERALAEGLSDKICAALQAGRRPEGMAEDEAVLFDFAVELLKAPMLSDATFERGVQAFGERGVVEVAYTLGFYGMIALVLKLAGLDRSEGGSLPLEPLADPFSS